MYSWSHGNQEGEVLLRAVGGGLPGFEGRCRLPGERKGIAYEEFRGHKLDRAMLELLRQG